MLCLYSYMACRIKRLITSMFLHNTFFGFQQPGKLKYSNEPEVIQTRSELLARGVGGNNEDEVLSPRLAN